MCGIYGRVHLNNDDVINLGSKVDDLFNRGPNEQIILEKPNFDLVFTRLSINGVLNGSQPFKSTCSDLICSVNGEIYNSDLLKEDLVSKGHKFLTDSDCEVIIHGFEEYGSNCFSKLNGMFAISIWDPVEQCLILARDRFGKKPLFYRKNLSDFEFGSELNTLSKSFDFDNMDVNKNFNIANYLCLDSTLGDSSILKNINKVPPGSYLNYNLKTNSVLVNSFYSLINYAASKQTSFNLDRINRIVHEAVADRLHSDVPIGTFLSSGVDSVLVTEKAVRLYGKKLPAFILGFQDKSYDESIHAIEIAKALEIEPVVNYISDEVIHDLYFKYIPRMSEPLNDPALIGLMFLAENAKKNVDVVLTGDGGDELLLGYPTMKLHSRRGVILPLLKLLNPFIKSLNIKSKDKYFDFGFKYQRLMRGLFEDDLILRDLLWRGGFDFNEVSFALTNLYTTDAQTFPIDLKNNFRKINMFEKDRPDQFLTLLYLQDYLLNTVLVKVDRGTMAFGVEARCPLLDYRLVEELISFDLQTKNLQFKNKKIFKDLIQIDCPKLLPFISKKKHGMGLPVSQWLKTFLKPRLDELTQSELIKEQNIFDFQKISQFKQEHLSGYVDRRKELWGILVFQEWYFKNKKGLIS
jgi:asparagine synthase (glutamine-hydrolysing)